MNFTIIIDRLLPALLVTSLSAGTIFAQDAPDSSRARRVNASVASAPATMLRYESARSDKFTGGKLPRARFAPGEPDLRITVDVPAFRLSLWQNGAVVSTYSIGIGLYDFQVPIGERKISQLIYNPPWIPPTSQWVQNSKTVKPGEIIDAEDPRNPLGKMKIPLGNGYLIHEARGTQDLGNLVSHGCIRMLRRDLYDLAEKIIAARSLPVTAKQIRSAKLTKKQFTVELDAPLPIALNYDTQVIEDGALHLYPDVYDRGTNTVARLRQELESNGIDPDAVDQPSYEKLLTRPTSNAAFITPVASVKKNLALGGGNLKPLVGAQARATSITKAKITTRSRAGR